jgi:hypothetical protein
MKLTSLISCALTCFTLSFLIAETANAKMPEGNQTVVLVDGAVLPLVRSYSATAKENSAFDVVIVADAALRKKLSEKYGKFDKWLKFEPDDAIVSRKNVYIHKASNREVYVNRFDVVSDEKKVCVVEWSRTISSIGGFTKTITLTFSEGGWIISEIKLKAVS